MRRCIKNCFFRKWPSGRRTAGRRRARNSAPGFRCCSGSASLFAAAPWLTNFNMRLLLALQSWSGWAPFVFIRDSKYGMPAVQSVHLMGLTILLVTVLVVDLRLAGLGRRDYGLSWLARQVKPWTLGTIAVMISTGLLMFLATPGKYVDSRPFRLKMALLCLALLFHFGVLRRFTAADSVSRPRVVNVLVALLSLTLWFGVGWAGRAIAFIP